MANILDIVPVQEITLNIPDKVTDSEIVNIVSNTINGMATAIENKFMDVIYENRVPYYMTLFGRFSSTNKTMAINLLRILDFLTLMVPSIRILKNGFVIGNIAKTVLKLAIVNKPDIATTTITIATTDIEDEHITNYVWEIFQTLFYACIWSAIENGYKGVTNIFAHDIPNSVKNYFGFLRGKDNTSDALYYLLVDLEVCKPVEEFPKIDRILSQNKIREKQLSNVVLYILLNHTASSSKREASVKVLLNAGGGLITNFTKILLLLNNKDNKLFLIVKDKIISDQNLSSYVGFLFLTLYRKNVYENTKKLIKLSDINIDDIDFSTGDSDVDEMLMKCIYIFMNTNKKSIKDIANLQEKVSVKAKSISKEHLNFVKVSQDIIHDATIEDSRIKSSNRVNNIWNSFVDITGIGTKVNINNNTPSISYEAVINNHGIENTVNISDESNVISGIAISEKTSMPDISEPLQNTDILSQNLDIANNTPLIQDTNKQQDLDTQQIKNIEKIDLPNKYNLSVQEVNNTNIVGMKVSEKGKNFIESGGSFFVKTINNHLNGYDPNTYYFIYSSKYPKNEGIGKLNPNVLNNFNRMSYEYFIRKNSKIHMNSGYRSPQYQQKLWEMYWCTPRAQGSKPANRPGYSLHEYGLAIDINTSEATFCENTGLLEKYGFWRPNIVKEPHHIQPKTILNANGDGLVKDEPVKKLDVKDNIVDINTNTDTPKLNTTRLEVNAPDLPTTVKKTSVFTSKEDKDNIFINDVLYEDIEENETVLKKYGISTIGNSNVNVYNTNETNSYENNINNIENEIINEANVNNNPSTMNSNVNVYNTNETNSYENNINNITNETVNETNNNIENEIINEANTYENSINEINSKVNNEINNEFTNNNISEINMYNDSVNEINSIENKEFSTINEINNESINSVPPSVKSDDNIKPMEIKIESTKLSKLFGVV